MRFILFAVSLVTLFGASFSVSVTDDSKIPQDVQDAVKEIRSLNGACILEGSGIKSIDFKDGSALKPELFDLFAKQADLQSLQIANYRELTDDDVTKLTGLKKLTTLKLANVGITNAAVKTIADAFPKLQNLDLSSDTKLSDDCTADIARLKELKSLSLLFCGISEFGIMDIAELPKLETLDIRAANIGDGGLAALAAIPSLKNLKHRSQTVTDEGVKSLTEAKNLTSLLLQDFSITGQSGQYLHQMSNLQSLEIFRCENFDSTGVTELKGLKLNRLTLRGIPVDDGGMEVFRALPTLKKLYLDELPSVTDVGMMNLVYLKELDTLEIWEVPVTDKVMETLAKLPKLKTLILRNTAVTDAGLEQVLSMPGLQVLTLQSNAKITPAVIQKIKDSKKITVN